MKLFAVIPVKPFAEGKSRLRPILPDAARRDLNRHMYEHVLEVAAAAIGAGGIIVVSADRAALDLARGRAAIAVREDNRAGLNAALRTGAATAVKRGAEAVLVLPTDLPAVSRDDIEALVRHADRSPFVIIAPDRSERGTNALLMSPPDAIGFSFGEDSFAAHLAAARARHMEPVAVRRAGLAFDVDTPEDYRRLVNRECQAKG
jgi:2-phospho-L-lactate guanylyltransferase